jgi:replication factor C large subunit
VAADTQKYIEWTEKYRPKTLSQVRGNDKAITALRNWAEAWNSGKPVKKGLIIAGKSGTGKTSAAYALASDYNWGLIELNASDARNATTIKNVALLGSVNETFTETGEFVSAKEGGRKLIVLDEAENLFERVYRSDPQTKDMSDSGGKAAIIETLRKTQQPIILIVNDLYELTRDSGAPIKFLTEVVKFNKIRPATVKQVLRTISETEGVKIMPDALDLLSKRADGDLRSAVNDLQLLAQGSEQITINSLNAVGFRNVKTTIFDAIREIFKTTEIDRARKSIRDLDESPDDLINWLDENLPLEYRRPPDLARGFDRLSRADQYLGKTRRRQYYRFWAYANDLMTSGVALAKQKPYHGWVKYRFPSWILAMSRTKQYRQLQKATAQKVGSISHTSRSVAKQEILPYFKLTFKVDHEFAVNQSINMDLSKEELGWLLDEKTDSNKVKYLLAEIKKELERKDMSGATTKSPEIFTPKRPKIEEDEDKKEQKKDQEQKEPKEEDTKQEDESKNEENKVQKNLFDY